MLMRDHPKCQLKQDLSESLPFGLTSFSFGHNSAAKNGSREICYNHRFLVRTGASISVVGQVFNLSKQDTILSYLDGDTY
jgi:hypothetical protein